MSLLGDIGRFAETIGTILQDPFGTQAPVGLPQQFPTQTRPTTFGGFDPNRGLAFQFADQFFGSPGGTPVPQEAPSVPQTVVSGDPSRCPQLFQPGMPTVRPLPLIMATNPVNGKITFWKHAGRPILFSGDLATCKRVAKIARRARSKR